LVEDIQEKKGHGKLSLAAKCFQKKTDGSLILTNVFLPKTLLGTGESLIPTYGKWGTSGSLVFFNTVVHYAHGTH
jgi:hypothetical protein